MRKCWQTNIKGRILQGRGAKYYIGNVTSVVLFDDIWPSGMHVTWPFVMPSRGLCRQSSYSRMLDFDPTQLCSMWTRADISGKLCRNKFMSDHCSGIAMWTRPRAPRFVKPGALIRIWGPGTLGLRLMANPGVPTEMFYYNPTTSLWQFMLFSMMPGRQTRRSSAHIHHINENKVKSLFKLRIRSQKDGLPPA